MPTAVLLLCLRVFINLSRTRLVPAFIRLLFIARLVLFTSAIISPFFLVDFVTDTLIYEGASAVVNFQVRFNKFLQD